MTITLRDQSTVEDVRFDRLTQFDGRSRGFGIAAINGNKPLRSYTWRCNAHFDQGVEGACVAYSLGHELASRPAEVTGINPAWLRKIYFEAQKSDQWAGGAYPGASPYYEGTSVLAGVKTLHKRGFFKSYRWAFGLNDVLQGLSYNGPCVIGVNWYSGMYEPDSNGFIRPSGYLAGGHAIMVRAINVKGKYVTLRNSWGKDWGVNGDCYMTFGDLEKLLHQQGEAVFLLNRTAKFHSETFLK